MSEAYLVSLRACWRHLPWLFCSCPPPPPPSSICLPRLHLCLPRVAVVECSESCEITVGVEPALEAVRLSSLPSLPPSPLHPVSFLRFAVCETPSDLSFPCPLQVQLSAPPPPVRIAVVAITDWKAPPADATAWPVCAAPPSRPSAKAPLSSPQLPSRVSVRLLKLVALSVGAFHSDCAAPIRACRVG